MKRKKSEKQRRPREQVPDPAERGRSQRKERGATQKGARKGEKRREGRIDMRRLDLVSFGLN